MSGVFTMCRDIRKQLYNELAVYYYDRKIKNINKVNLTFVPMLYSANRLSCLYNKPMFAFVENMFGIPLQQYIRAEITDLNSYVSYSLLMDNRKNEAILLSKKEMIPGGGIPAPSYPVNAPSYLYKNKSSDTKEVISYLKHYAVS